MTGRGGHPIRLPHLFQERETMRPLMVSLLIPGFFLGGCASKSGFFPPGEDPDQLVQAIAQRARDDTPPPPSPPPPPGFRDTNPYLWKTLRTTEKVTETCLVLSIPLAIGCAAAAAHGSAGGLHFGGLGETISKIWEED